MTGLEVAGLAVHAAGRWVLRGVDLTVAPGDVVGLVGANGAGKSTLLHAVAGLRRYEGTVRISGHDARDPAARRRLGLAETLGPVERTVDQLLSLVVALRGRGDVPAVRRRLGLTDGPVDRLSEGQRRRLALALAVVHEPDVVLLDEPLTHLDADGLARVADLVRAEAGRGAAVLVATHRPEALPLQRVVGLADGVVDS